MQKTITLKSVLMCSNCYNYTDADLKVIFKDIPENVMPEIAFNNHSYHICPKCNKFVLHFAVDKEIADAVHYFNKLGYRTSACCQGHFGLHTYKNKFVANRPYVYLYSRKKLTRELYDKLCLFGWNDFYIGVFDQKKHKHIKHINNFKELSKSTTNIIYYSSKLIDEYLKECNKKYPNDRDEIVKEMNKYFAKQCQQLAKILGGESLNEQKTSKSRNDIKT